MTIKQAAILTGESKGVWCRRANREVEHARSIGRKGQAVKAPLGCGSARIVWWICPSIDHRLAVSWDEQARRDGARSFAQAGPKMTRAWRKDRWLIAYGRARAAWHNRRNRTG